MDSSRVTPGRENSDITTGQRLQEVERTQRARSTSADTRKAALDELQKAYKELSDLEKDMPKFGLNRTPRSGTPPPADR